MIRLLPRFRFAHLIAIVLGVAFWLLVVQLISGAPQTIFYYLKGDFDSETEGRIIHSEIDRHGRGGMTYDIVYWYELDGTIYTSSQINFQGNYKNTAVETHRRYPEGKDVTVYYDGANPNLSVLEKTSLGLWTWGQFLAAIIMAGFSIFFVRD